MRDGLADDHRDTGGAVEDGGLHRRHRVRHVRYSGILTALYDRERTARGATLRVALIDALAEWMTQPAYFSHYGGEPPRRTGARHPSISPYGLFRTADGSVFFGIQNEREWCVFCADILRQAGRAADARFATNMDRAARNDELTAIIEDSFAGRTSDDVSQALEAAGIAGARLRTPGDSPGTRNCARGVAGVRSGRPGVTSTHCCRRSRPRAATGHGAVPVFGEHNEAIRVEFGGEAPDSGVPAESDSDLMEEPA